MKAITYFKISKEKEGVIVIWIWKGRYFHREWCQQLNLQLTRSNTTTWQFLFKYCVSALHFLAAFLEIFFFGFSSWFLRLYWIFKDGAMRFATMPEKHWRKTSCVKSMREIWFCENLRPLSNHINKSQESYQQRFFYSQHML